MTEWLVAVAAFFVLFDIYLGAGFAATVAINNRFLVGKTSAKSLGEMGRDHKSAEQWPENRWDAVRCWLAWRRASRRGGSA